jgi:hypothetical protein
MRTDVESIATPTTSRPARKLGLTAPALALLALASGGCFLFGGSKPPPEPVPEPEPAGPVCEKPDGAIPAPVGTTLIPLEMWNDAIVGTTVYSLIWDDDEVLVGEPLRICSFRNSGQATISGEGGYEIPPYPVRATVMNVLGQQFEVPVESVSSTPPLLSLAAPGKVEDLIKTTFVHAHQLHMARFQINKKYITEGLTASKKVGDVWEVNWDYILTAGLDKAAEVADNKVLHYLVHGRMARESLLGQRSYAWIAKAEDDRIVDFYAEGSKTAPDYEVYEAMSSCISALKSVNDGMLSLGRYEDARREKKWRKGLEGASEAQLAKMDAAEEKKLDADKDRTMSFINEHYDSKKCQKAREFTGVAAPPAPF